MDRLVVDFDKCSQIDVLTIIDMVQLPCHVDAKLGWIIDAKGFAVVRETTQFTFDEVMLNFICDCLNALEFDEKKAS